MSEVLPAFEAVENREASEALSEPFVRPEAYAFLSTTDLVAVEPVAVGVAYISDNDQVKYGFALSQDATRPLQAAQRFSELYDREIGYRHAARAKIDSELGADPGKDETHKAIEKTKSEGLQTIAGVSVYLLPDERDNLQDGLLVVRRVFEELPLEARDRLVEGMGSPRVMEEAAIKVLRAEGGPSTKEQIERIQKGILQNDKSNQMYGVTMAALLLPEPKMAKRIIAEDSRVGDFLAHPRKERRKLLKKELRGS